MWLSKHNKLPWWYVEIRFSQQNKKHNALHTSQYLKHKANRYSDIHELTAFFTSVHYSIREKGDKFPINLVHNYGLLTYILLWPKIINGDNNMNKVL